MYRTTVLQDFRLPDLRLTRIEGDLAALPTDGVLLVWASPRAFRRAGIWARLLKGRRWQQLIHAGNEADLEAIVPASLRTTTLWTPEPLPDFADDQVVALLIVGSQVQLAMQDSPTEDAWERFENDLLRLQLG